MERAPAALVLALLVLPACKPLANALTCTSDRQCTGAGAAGFCEPNGSCSAADPTCASGRRYRFAGTLDRQCVAPGGDGAVVDGAVVDGAVAAGDGGAADLGPSASLCAGFTGLVCEGFESATLGSAWMTYLPNASYDRDPTRSARGQLSGNFHLGAISATGATYGELADYGIPTTGTVASRAFFYLPSMPPADSRLLAFHQTQSPYRHLQVGYYQGKMSAHSAITNASPSSTVDLPIGRWFCLELVVTFGATGSVRSYLDGQELTSLRIDENTVTTPPISGSYFGIAFDNPGMALPAYDYWIDELAIDTTRIGCTR